jgi:hypothetical protein
MSGVLLYVLLLPLLELTILILLSASGDKRVPFSEETDDTGCDLVVSDGFVVFTNDDNA